jgi:Protein of unknown function (DUF2938)
MAACRIRARGFCGPTWQGLLDPRVAPRRIVTDLLELATRGVVMGVGGAALMDVWAWFLRRRFGIRGLDYAMLGRWLGHFTKGRFVHDRMADASPIPFERPLGWLAHYSIGIAFAWVLLGIWGIEWARSPTLLPAMAIGIGTIVAPWFVMQPAMGAGFAASKTPDPRASRLRNLATHAVYGLGLYGSAWLLAVMWN